MMLLPPRPKDDLPAVVLDKPTLLLFVFILYLGGFCTLPNISLIVSFLVIWFGKIRSRWYCNFFLMGFHNVYLNVLYDPVVFFVFCFPFEWIDDYCYLMIVFTTSVYLYNLYTFYYNKHQRERCVHVTTV